MLEHRSAEVDLQDSDNEYAVGARKIVDNEPSWGGWPTDQELDDYKHMRRQDMEHEE